MEMENPQEIPAAEVVVPAGPAVYGNASLYVGDLDLGVGNEELFNIFKKAAPVVSVRVCRDQVSLTSLGYGYVNFNTQEDAVRAMEALNFSPINSKQIRISFSHRDPNARKPNKANLFIKNLHQSIDNKTLFDLFSTFGTVLSSKVNTDPTGQSLGFGYVQLDSESAADKAIESLNNMLLNDKQVYVGRFMNKEERESKKDGFTNLYIKNLPIEFTDEDLQKEFGEFGEITSCVVMKDDLGNSKCFGFVNFSNADVAKKAVEIMNGKNMGENEKVLYVGRAMKKAEREKELRERRERERRERREKTQGMNLYVKNLDESIGDQDLSELFEQFGEITSSKVMVDAVGRSKGSGFVAFTTSEAADKAIKEMSGKIIGRKPLYVALAQRKEERRAMLMAHFAQLNAANNGIIYPHHHPARLPTFPPPAQPLYYPPAGAAAGPALLSPVVPSPAGGYGFHAPAGVSPSYVLPYYQRRGGPRHHHPQQMVHSQGYRHTHQNGRTGSTTDQNGPVQLDATAGDTVRSKSTPIPVSTLTMALASATPDNQRLMLGEQLYPLVEQIEREQAGKVTGMLLEMDKTEILHLIESPDALKSKVNEAMEVLRLAHTNGNGKLDGAEQDYENLN
ncbi:hypothetical protein LUZ60_012385 [Juncus effusus]|nr:hypothetical protein LUZ60_012385 [Juncus effusus]